MQIAIIGAGKVGTALGTGWARAGHRLVFGVTNPADPKHAAAAAQADGAAVAAVGESAAGSGVVVLAVP